MTGCGGCKNTTEISLSNESSKAIVQTAKKLSITAAATFKTFVQLEKDHRDAYWAISHDIKHKADWLRTPVPDPTQVIPPGGGPPIFEIPRAEAYIKTLDAAVDAFEANETPEGRATLQAAIATVQLVLDDVKKLQAEAQ
jgi:hypothetical protein